MRAFSLILFFISTNLYAELSCLKINSNLNGENILCDQGDGNKVMALRCDDESTKCFTGNGKALVEKINSGIFTDGEAVIGDAILSKNEQEIYFTYGDLSQSCETTVSECKK